MPSRESPAPITPRRRLELLANDARAGAQLLAWHLFDAGMRCTRPIRHWLWPRRPSSRPL